MTKMPDKGITSITYNHLNLPKEIAQVNNTKYFYRADGVKTKKIFTLNNSTGSTPTTSEYLDGFQYVTRSAEIAQALRSTDEATMDAKTAGQEETFVSREAAAVPQQQTMMVLSFFPTAEGFYDVENSKYIWQYKDHLGNVRLSYAQDSAGALEIVDRNDFYPFGMNFVGYYSVFDAQGSLFNYKYQSQELQETGFYDFGFRQYMPDIGRWMTVDPLAEQYRRWSPFNYAMNNPMRFIDPDGRGTEDWVRKDGKWQYDASVTTVEQAQKMANVDGFAKNGTVLSDAKIGANGESGYVRLNEGGTADYLPNDGFQNQMTNASVMLSQTMGGGNATTWTHENYFSVITGGFGRPSSDNLGSDMIRPGDNVTFLSKDGILFPNGGGSGDMFGNALSKFNHIFGNLGTSLNNASDAIGLTGGNSKIDTIDYKMKTWNFDATQLKDTTVIWQFQRNNDSLFNLNLRKAHSVDSISSSRLHKSIFK